MLSDKKDITALELLAPVKDLSTGRAAIMAGADALYIGSPRFGARQAAGNSWDDIRILAGEAHFFGVRLYVVLNTIFFDEEDAAMQDSLDAAGHCGADAIIIQDPGILELRLPKIPVFISTQAHNINAAKICFWESLGVRRVILARELSLIEISKIRSQSGIELESFIHGALCVGYSGRCYLSQEMCGRSANRGACMQACRLPYRLVDGQGKAFHGGEKSWLSLKDLRADNRLEELIAAGVSSFKIEGRLKDMSYVANTTAYYRRLLDDIIQKNYKKYRRSSFGISKHFFTPDPSKSFNRGFCDYYLGGSRDAWRSLSSASLGEPLGKILHVNRGNFRFSAEVTNGDGLVFFRQGELIGGAYVNQSNGDVRLSRILPLRVGDDVFRNENPAFEDLSANGSRRFIRLDISVRIFTDKLELDFLAENGSRVSLLKRGAWPKARQPELAAFNLEKQLGKFGNSPFIVSSFHAFGLAPFIPLSEINKWRREAVSILSKEIVSSYLPFEFKAVNNASQLYPDKEIGFEHNVANGYARRFYERHGAMVLEEAMEKTGLSSRKPLMVSKYCLRSELGACLKEPGSLSLPDPLFLIREGRRYRLDFDCRTCVMRLFAAEDDKS